MLKLISVTTCPECGHCEEERMRENTCLYASACKGCSISVKQREDDCYVFCSDGSVPRFKETENW